MNENNKQPETAKQHNARLMGEVDLSPYPGKYMTPSSYGVTTTEQKILAELAEIKAFLRELLAR